jgi:hypothetical protein
VQRRNFAELTNMLVQFRTIPGFQRSPTKPITPTVAIIIFGGLRELAAQMVEDEIDRRTVVGPARGRGDRDSGCSMIRSRGVEHRGARAGKAVAKVSRHCRD